MRLLSLTKSIVKTRDNFQGPNDIDREGAPSLFEINNRGRDESSSSAQFNKMCSESKEGDEEGWERIRYWLRSHSEEQVREAIVYKGDNEMTALHCVCRSDPPEDICNAMIDLGSDALESPDHYGWLPIHYACACSASPEVISRMNEESPYGKTTVDRRGRAPIHFALSNINPTRPMTSGTVASLINTGAATYPDDGGMLPLHYACAYGADDEIIQTLVEAHPDALIAMDDKGRTPLLFCLANCDREYAMAATRYMLEKNKDVVNRYDGDQVPLHALADHAHQIKESEGMVNAAKCLELYMNTEPLPTADLISAIQQLPDWLLEEAVHLHVVQVLLNQKTSQPFPTAILMFDFYILILMVVSFSTLIVTSIHLRYDNDPDNDALGGAKVAPLYVGIAYFISRELIQLIGVSSLGALSTYFTDATNLLDICYISIMIYWSVSMHLGSGDAAVFRTGTALTLGLVWMNVMVYLKNVMIDLAIFVAGVTYVVKRLGAFLLATVIFLVCFAQIFMTLYQQTDYCKEYIPSSEKDIEEVKCSEDEERPWCSFWPAFIRVLSMMLGAVDEQQFREAHLALFFYVLFFFLVVILLANVLIAIVTDSYSVVRNERAAIVFWTNRLDFVGEMDAIANGPWMWGTRWFYGLSEEDEKMQSGMRSTFGTETWSELLDMFEEEVEDLGFWSGDAWKLFFNRILIAFVILPLWILLGLVTAGILWPPEVREFVFVEAIATRLSDHEDESAEQQRILEVETIQEDLEDMSDELAQQLATDRANIVQIKTSLNELRHDVMDEVKDMKRLMAQVIEQRARGAQG